ncbi:hypothetical protein VD0002_g7246 [Verticillium dahliae]|uniref:Uncharacterized protein n=2 Tax=Verticillium dahliae TaxID=27337 RepID=G2X293_VERDV|nr:uncharacterized protein VDAG_04417 [Verticillium dahliae VdLs.17]KAF3346203.1 Pre-mRNA-processing factor 39 [Verticillium dahliae VDG2]KAH6700232.1 hypothetical protein EV126DRAFT_511959 [Verticillium dahliae]EGY22979.1 hypothetical protein VDAG_04417 [Verticillium dahliae VdLs.17]PNH31916.1 hypothetical protein BJF96_g4775 [Verticillium dahliae]PNH48810.1 hypothetical protein VD0003_g8313 [Verticillium dahliae]
MSSNKKHNTEATHLPLFLHTRLTVVETLWDLALAYFTIRTAAIYAAATLTGEVLLRCAEGWAPTSARMPTMMPLRALLVAACAWAIIARYEMPRDWRFRGAVGGVAGGILLAGLVGLVRLGGCGMDVGVGTTAVLTGVMPLALMVLERREGCERTGKAGEKHVGGLQCC